MSFFNKNKICVTHNGTFHADDLFATATLSILNKGNIKIIRTRDPKVIEKGDYVYDVGGIYDEEKDLFDHHQKGGAGFRHNSIPYASFGLVWKKYGEQICGSKEVAVLIDQKLAQQIDALDNGKDFASPIYEDSIISWPNLVFLNNMPTWKEGKGNIDNIFRKQAEKATEFLSREIEVAKADVEANNIMMDAYSNAEDKRIIIINNDFPRYLYQTTLSKLEEPIYIVMPSGHSSMWKVEAVSISPDTIESRKLFPESWRGFFNGDPKLKKVTGVADADFCHSSGFLITALSYEGAMKLAQKALIA